MVRGLIPSECALITKKAFDSADHDLGIEVLRRLAFPRRIVNLISHQWEHHKRWISFADNISETPVTHARGLPQGDPWSPIILALLLVLPMRRQMRLFPGTVPYLFLDDRTLVSQTLNDLLAARDCWEELSTVSRMKTQPDKTQFWGRTPAAYHAIQTAGLTPQFTVNVLGIDCGMYGRAESENETKRKAKCERLAARIAILPHSLRFKASLASILLSPTMSWGIFLGGYFPNQTFIKSLKNNFFLATKGSLDDDSQTSRQLLQVFLFGHTCDLIYISAQKALRALCKWHSKHSDVQISADSSFIKLLTRAMNMLNCEIVSVGAFQFGDTRWSFQTPVEWCERLSHHFRTWWRTQTMQHWLSSHRNDAQLARASGLTLSQKFVEQIHLQTRDLDGHQCSIASGGFVSAAKWETKDFCEFCNDPICPSTEHVMWFCSRFSSLRLHPKPQCGLTARLGWGPRGISLPVVQQMGLIRASAVKLRKQNQRHSQDSADDGVGDPGGVGGGGPCLPGPRAVILSFSAAGRRATAATACHRAVSKSADVLISLHLVRVQNSLGREMIEKSEGCVKTG